MSLRNVYMMAREYLFTGGILVLILVSLFLVIRHIHAKRHNAEHKKINIKRLLWWFVFLCYIFVVIGATMLSRGGSYEYSRIPPLFYSYKTAWSNWSDTEWRNIILNICMFVPFGFLLPLGVKRFRKFYLTYAAGFMFSLFIELSQRIFKIGIFEPDDLLDNTIGAVIGFGLFLLLFKLCSKEKEEIKWSATVAANIPLVLTAATFLAILFVYTNKELGNNNNCYSMLYDSKKLNIRGEKFTDNTEKTAMVYKTETYTDKEAAKLAEEIFKRFDGSADIEYTSRYDDEVWVRSRIGDDTSQVIVEYAGGTFDYSVMGAYSRVAVSFPEEEVRKVLARYGYDIDEKAKFSAGEDLHASFEVDMCEAEGSVIDGNLSVWLSKDKRIMRLKDNLVTLTAYKEFPIISEAEAYKRLTEGKFKRYGNDYLDIEVLSVKLSYSIDSKGFYQPNYRFDVNINGKEAGIMIPAINGQKK